MHMEKDAKAWAQDTFGDCELGDKRRTRRVVSLAGSLAAHVGDSPYAACRGDAAANEGAYRLLRNDAVEAEAVAESGYRASVRAASESEVVLAIEDTTTLSYGHAVKEELGDIGGPEGSAKGGFLVHSVLLVDAQKEHTLGLAAQQRWRRERQARGRGAQRRERTYEDKESFKWQRASQQLSERLGGMMERVISVCDREADVFEYLTHKDERGERFVVRAAQNRRTTQSSRLFEQLHAAPVLGTREVTVAQRGGRRGRRVQVELRGCEVELREPKSRDTGRVLRVNALLVHETAPPQGTTALNWVLLTSESIDDEACAQRIVRHYELRWRIEDFHKAWKSEGTQVEARRMQSPDNLERIAVMLAFVAVRLMQLREVLYEPTGADAPAQPRRCTEVLTNEQWKMLWLTREKNKRLPKKPPSLRWAYESVAKLGGWIDTKRTGRAGWKALWEGWFILEQRVEGYQLAQQLRTR